MGYQLTFHVFRHRQLLDLASNLLGEKKPHGLAVLDASPAGAKQQKVLNQHQYGVQRGCRGYDLPARGSKSLSSGHARISDAAGDRPLYRARDALEIAPQQQRAEAVREHKMCAPPPVSCAGHPLT